MGPAPPGDRTRVGDARLYDRDPWDVHRMVGQTAGRRAARAGSFKGRSCNCTREPPLVEAATSYFFK